MWFNQFLKKIFLMILPNNASLQNMRYTHAVLLNLLEKEFSTYIVKQFRLLRSFQFKIVFFPSM